MAVFDNIADNPVSDAMEKYKPIWSTLTALAYPAQIKWALKNFKPFMEGMINSVITIEKSLELQGVNKDLFVDTKRVIAQIKILIDFVKANYWDYEHAIDLIHLKLNPKPNMKRKELTESENLLHRFIEAIIALKTDMIVHNDQLAVFYTNDGLGIGGKYFQIKAWFAADSSVKADDNPNLVYIARPIRWVGYSRAIMDNPTQHDLKTRAEERENNPPESKVKIDGPQHAFYLGKRGIDQYKIPDKTGLVFSELDLRIYKNSSDYEFLKIDVLSSTSAVFKEPESYKVMDDLINAIQIYGRKTPTLSTAKEYQEYLKNNPPTQGGIRKRITRKGRKRQLRKKYSKTRKHY